MSEGDQFANGIQLFNNTTDSTDITTGGSVFGGGVGIAKNLNVGGILGLSDSTNQYIRVKAPSVLTTPYTLTLPLGPPTAGQVLSANGMTPTTLEWTTPSGGSVPPSSSHIVYVSSFGNE
jgi:hypothetical protein